ncbi:hypothetical protein VU12_14180, partial [Desulfobulbus sp. US4]|nr:hypothetical protein [Desulfobulbus sp. US4]
IFGIQKRTPYEENSLKDTDINLDAFPGGYKDSKDEDKLYSTAQRHGGFGDLPFWREETWKGQPLSGRNK